MLHSRRMAFTGSGLLVIIALAMALIAPLRISLAVGPTSLPAHTHTSHYLPLSRFHLRGIDGPYHTQGNLIYGADNRPYLFHGVGRDGLEFNCAGDGHFDAQELSYMGLGNNTAHATYWGGNIVRLPL